MEQQCCCKEDVNTHERINSRRCTTVHRLHNNYHRNERRSLRKSNVCRNFPKLVLWILLGYFTVTITDAQNMWWDLATDSRVYQFSSFSNPELFILGSQPLCAKLPGLSQSQQKLCQLYQDHMGPIGDGAKAAIEECKHQFTDRRWNCSSLEGQGVFGRATSVASRETAFTYAISSAAVAHSISRACREGRLSTCLCGEVDRPEDLDRAWEWMGCGDNVDYGIRFARQFVDATEMESNPKRRSKEYAKVKMNLHNNEAGRKIIHQSIGVQCKCHGVSGSCSLQSCWPEMDTFRDIGLVLKEKYNGAARTQVNKKGKLIHRGAPRFSKPTRTDLVYLDVSPDYCDYDPSVGSLGTRGRECNRTSEGTDGCNQMCCGRGYNSFTEEVVERCKCKFKWCCYVRCRKCMSIMERNVCK